MFIVRINQDASNTLVSLKIHDIFKKSLTLVYFLQSQVLLLIYVGNYNFWYSNNAQTASDLHTTALTFFSFAANLLFSENELHKVKILIWKTLSSKIINEFI